MRLRGLLMVASALAAVSVPLSAQAEDEVLVWNELLLDTYRLMGGCPCPLSRIGAMMSGAVFDAVNSIDGSYQPYLSSVPASPTASKEAAAAQAAHDVLVHVFPSLQPEYDAQLVASLAAIPDGPEKAEGIQIGAIAAAEMIAARQNDGWNEYVPYNYGTGPGEWRPTWPDYQPPCNSHWGTVTPWGIESGDQFRPPAPPPLNSPEYTTDFNDVKEYGRINSILRTSDQFTIAWFWANDRDGSYKPPGHLVDITGVLSEQFGLSLVENARIFALLNIAMADAAIAAWDAKYLTDLDLWRPIHGIRSASNDGNPETLQDGSWVPLGTVSPAFPAYISGHSTFGAAHAAIMRNYFGTDDVTFTCSTDDPRLQPGETLRTFHSFTEAALENGRSRIYLGVHWQMDCDRGYEVGTEVGNWIYERYLQPVAPSDLSDAASGSELRLVLSRIAPNPTRHRASLDLVLPVAGRLDLAVYDPSGRRVFDFPSTEEPAGPASFEWDLRDQDRRDRVPAGVYFVRGAFTPAEANAAAAPSQAQARLVVLP